MNPPLRSARDREAILEGIVDGTIEVICSDHAPQCDYEKEVEFDYAPFGITGLETGPEGLRVAPVALAEIPRFTFTLCCGRHRGVRLRILPGRLAIRVPASPEGPLAVVLPGGRRLTVAPGQERWFRL